MSQHMIEPPAYRFPTLPDYLAPGLQVVFVGINPSLSSVERGHYFARSTSRFWPAFSRSRLSAAVRAGLGVAVLGPQHDAALLQYGIGFTDVVKLPSRKAAQLRAADFAVWAPRLRQRLLDCQPIVVCFHGVTGYRAFLTWAMRMPRARISLGLQPERLGCSSLFVVPNPSPANAHTSLAEQARWYDCLADYLEQIGEVDRVDS